MNKCKVCGQKDEDSNPLMRFQYGRVYVSGDRLVYDGWDYYSDQPDDNEVKINYCPMCGRKLSKVKLEENDD